MQVPAMSDHNSRPTRPTPQPGILDIALYQGGASKIAGQSNVVKLSSNENPFGPSPKAIAAYRDAALNLHRYPNTDHAELRTAIGARYDLDPDQIICGAGSDEIIAFLCNAYAGPGDEVIHTEHGFGMYKISALAAGATPVEVPEDTRQTDVDAILDAVTPRTKLVFIANPNNPTGTMIGADEVARLAGGLPGNVILVLDGAYAEFEPEFDAGASLIQTHDNVVMTRTFSKVFGLGALRVGWGYGPRAIIDVLNRIRGPFNLGSGALAAAEAAVADVAYTDHCLAENAKWRAWLIEALAKAGVPCDPSHTNFILARFDSPEIAIACNEALIAEGVLVRMVAGYKLPECLRITVGDEAATKRVAHTIAGFMAGRPE